MYLVVEVGNNLSVITGHDRRIEPGVVSSCNEAFGSNFAGSAYWYGIVGLGQSDCPLPEFFDIVVGNQLDDDCIILSVLRAAKYSGRSCLMVWQTYHSCHQHLP